ncbi:MAG TPA: arsenic resistance N-acetyltransferase ArsN2 [Deltaproteobacteria bacterium]|nr:arsenic resistance N-acetyltransferase ArsN2 [Deltaproteobacteria bacterium]
MDRHCSLDACTPRDREALLGLLSQAGLPSSDLDPDTLRHFLVARETDGSIVAAVGMEISGEDALLRSLVVHPDWQGLGIGRRLLHEMEAKAREQGVRTVYLLTVTAPGYFPAFGYSGVDRARVPGAIAQTQEFSSICPASAVCMCKDLGRARRVRP